MKIISQLIVLLLSVQPLFSQYKWSALDSEIEAKQKILGENLVIMIWDKDSMLYKKEVGGFNSKTQAPIASSSKWLTAALVMQFVDEGKLSLDDKVVKYIPEFEKYFKSYITIRHCLSHMTGIEDEGGLLKKLFKRKKLASLEEEVNDFAARDIRANAGTDFWYGNIGLNIAGRVLEVISKKKFEILIRTKLFTPLGMTKTTFAEVNGGPVNPSGGAKSTADDYMKFLMMLLNKGKYNGVQILSESSVNEMRLVQNSLDQIAYAPKSAQGFKYASGSWVLEEIVFTKTTVNGNPYNKPLVPMPPGDVSVTKTTIATTLSSPGLFGTWPMVDFCRGYAYLVFVKNFLGEERADAHLNLKKVVDEQMKNDCK